MSMNIHMNTAYAGLNVAYDNIVNGKWQETKTSSSYQNFEKCVALSDKELSPLAKKVCKTALIALTAYVAYLTVPVTLATIVSLTAKAAIIGLGTWAVLNTFNDRINPTTMKGLDKAEDLFKRDVANLVRILRGERTSVYREPVAVDPYDGNEEYDYDSIDVNNLAYVTQNLYYNNDEDFGNQ